jgi:hypothetical protein
MAMDLVVADKAELRLTVTEILARPTGLVGNLVPPLTEAELRQHLLAQLAALAPSGQIRVERGTIVLNLIAELGALWDSRR